MHSGVQSASAALPSASSHSSPASIRPSPQTGAGPVEPSLLEPEVSSATLVDEEPMEVEDSTPLVDVLSIGPPLEVWTLVEVEVPSAAVVSPDVSPVLVVVPDVAVIVVCSYPA
jgi:hypothetical protein